MGAERSLRLRLRRGGRMVLLRRRPGCLGGVAALGRGRGRGVGGGGKRGMSRRMGGLSSRPNGG